MSYATNMRIQSQKAGGPPPHSKTQAFKTRSQQRPRLGLRVAAATFAVLIEPETARSIVIRANAD
jgi:hypothetical protein